MVADSAGTLPYFDEVTAGFVYVRLHGDDELYTSGYTSEALDRWATLIRAWRAGEVPVGEQTLAPPAPSAAEGRDVLVYFDNDAKVHAPFDAIALRRARRLSRDTLWVRRPSSRAGGANAAFGALDVPNPAFS